jgi:integrase/recombinase XerD
LNTLRQAVGDYLTMRRNLGFKLLKAGRELPDFVTFMERRRATYVTHALALKWAQIPRRTQPALWASRLTAVRQFALFRSATDPRTQVPASGLLPFRPKRATPHLYTNRQIADLLHAILHKPLSPYCSDPRGCMLLPWVYYSFFGLLSVTGLRVGEALNLKVEDVDLSSRVLIVRGGKFGKDRLVPLHPSTCKVLRQYERKRNEHWADRPVSSYFFVSSRGKRLSGSQVHVTFYAASRQIGLRGARDRHGPRIHDFRHRFATTTLVNWYRSNQDPERLLPVLSTFLGHVHVADTQWYLSASPELMREAMRRLEHRWGKAS